MIRSEYRYKVTHATTATFKPGDIVRPIKRTAEGWLIGYSYHKSLYFTFKDDVTGECYSDRQPDLLLVAIERIK